MARPSKWKDEYLELAYKLALLGCTDKEMADIMEVTEATFNNWKKSKEGLFESLKKGKFEADGNIAQSLYKRAQGYDVIETREQITKEGTIYTKTSKHIPADPASIAIWLRNRHPEKWTKGDKSKLNKKEDDEPIKVNIVNGKELED